MALICSIALIVVSALSGVEPLPALREIPPMVYRILLPMLTILLFAGCANEEGENYPTRAVGFSAGLGSAESMASTATSGAVQTAATFVLAYYDVTERQRQVALQNAQRAVAVIHSQPKKREAVKKRRFVTLLSTQRKTSEQLVRPQ